MIRTSAVLAATMLLTQGCKDTLTGPAPELADPMAGQPLPVEPGVICAEQLTTSVVVRGDRFSPTPYDIPDDPKAALPSLTLIRAAELDGSPADGSEVGWGGEPDNLNAQRLSWQSRQQMTFVVDQSLALTETTTGRLPAGLYDARIQDASGAEATSHATLAALDKPQLSALTPAITCLAQGPRTVGVSGETLLRLEGRDATLQVEDLDAPFVLSAFSECTTIPHPALSAEICRQANLELAADAIPVGYPLMTIDNPETAACSSTDDARLRVVPPPTIDTIEPPILCVSEGDRDVVIAGQDFLVIDGANPIVTLDGASIAVVGTEGCEDLETQGHAVQKCTSVTVTIPQQDTAAPRTPEIRVANPEPAGCQDTVSDQLVLVPPPDVQDIQPPVICDDGTEQTLVASGQHFFTIDGVLPHVMVDGSVLEASKVSARDCEPLEVPRLSVQQCATLDLVVSPAQVEGDAATIALTNPDPAGCSDTYAIDVPLVDPPAITSAAPALVCTEDGAREIVIGGSSFMVVEGVLPTVTLNGAPVEVTGRGRCDAPIAIGPVSGVEICDELTVSAPQGSLAPGAVEVGVENPAPIFCAGVSDDVLVAPPALTITDAQPASVCTASGDTSVTISGTGFLEVDGQVPAVTLAGEVFAVVGGSLAGCQDVDVPGATVRSCSALDVFVPQGAFAQGDVPIAVTNPAPSGCAETATGVFFGVPVPDVQAVAPSNFCSATGDTLSVTGADFSPASRVLLEDDGGIVAEASVTFIDEGELAATFPGGIGAGIYDLRVQNAEGCDDTLAGAVEVHPTPLVFFVDPPVDYSGITIQATIYLSGLQEDAASVVLLGPNGEEEILSGSSAPGQPNRITAPIPAGLASGSWAVRVTSQLGCVGVLDGALSVTDDLSVTISDVDPRFVWQGANTSITISSEDGDFVRTPRAYLNPKQAAAGTPATNVRAVLFDNSTTLTGVVPGTLLQQNQDYELIVVNPDGTVGLFDAVRVTEDRPPVVNAIVPASFDANAPFPAVIEGEHLDVASISMRCLVPQGDGSFSLFPAQDAEPLTVSFDAGSAAATRVEATFPADEVGVAGSICTVTVTNADGASFRFSAASIKNPSQNLAPWRSTGQTLTSARRALGLVAGRPTASSRFLYAIGGDDGATANAISSVEVASVDIFGGLGEFVEHTQNPLPSGRAFAGAARVGRYLYVVGGDDGDGAQSTLLRAQILDPLATPEFVDLGIAVNEDNASGVGEGTWIYRIAALFSADDPGNPGGESLPGEPIVVQLPQVAGLELAITWDEIPGAVGYRVYRTPAADGGVDDVALLGSTDAGDATTFTDDGRDATSQRPLPQGALGVWHEAGDGLVTARQGHGVAVSPHPTDAGAWLLYAVGGRVPGAGAAGALLDSYEVARVDVTEPLQPKGTETQSVGPFTAYDDQLSVARADLGVFVVTDADVADPAPSGGNDFKPGARGEIWLFIGPGRAAGGAESVIEVGVVKDDGSLGYPTDTPARPGDPPLMEPGTNPPAVFGYGAGVANGFLFIVGGGNSLSSPDNRVRSGEMCQGVPNQCGGDNFLPEIRNFTPQGGGVLSEARILPGVTQESAFFFAAGGVTEGGAVSDTVDTTVQ